MLYQFNFRVNKGKYLLSTALLAFLLIPMVTFGATVTVQTSDHSQQSAGFDGTNHFSSPLNSKTSGQIVGELISVSIWIENTSGSTRNTDVALLGYEYDSDTDTNVNGSNALAYSVQCNVAQVPVTGSYDDFKTYDCDNVGNLTMPAAAEGNYIIWYVDVAEAFTNYSLRVKGSASDLNAAVTCEPRPSGSDKCGDIVDTYVQISYTESGGDPCDEGNTRICGFTPENGTTIEASEGYADVEFTLDAWIKEQDVDGLNRVRVELTNIDQNVLLFGLLSANSITLLNEVLGEEDAGHFEFATTTPLPTGNYRIRASLQKTLILGFITNPFDETARQEISKQFIVGEGTYIGNLSQNGFSILYGDLNTRTATSSIALVAHCNPLGDFDMVDCMAGLFIPDAGQVQTTIQGAKDGILTRWPWGYATRFATILTNSATSTLPSYTVTFAGNTAEDTHSLSFSPSDMLAGGASLLADVRDPYNNKNARDIFEPIIQVFVALLVILTIIADVMSSHRHEPEVGASNRKRL